MTDDVPQSNTFMAELLDGLSKARDAIYSKEHGWKKVTYKELGPISEAIVELSQNFTEHELLLLGTYVAAMSRQAITGE